MLVSFDFDTTLQLLNGEPNEEFVAKFREHVDKGDTMIIVTSRGGTKEDEQEINEFLQSNMLEVDHIYYTEYQDKGPILKHLGVKLHYDDDLAELMSAHDNGVKSINAYNDQADAAYNEYYGFDEANNFKTFFESTQRVKVYLDDLRPTPEGWIGVRWPEEVIELLKTGNVSEISLDHDLGDDEHGTGNDVITWIEEQVFLHDFVPPKISLHTDNASARKKMSAGINQIWKLYDRKRQN